MSASSLKKIERMRKKEDFMNVRKKGKRRSTKSFSLFFLKNELNKRRIGISISKKTGTAAQRNKIKRWIKEFFRQNKEEFPATSDTLVNVKSIKELKAFSFVAAELRNNDKNVF